MSVREWLEKRKTVILKEPLIKKLSSKSGSSNPQTISETLEILDKAIKDENEAISFYMDAYERTSEPIEVARLFRELALEEQKHRERLAEGKRLVRL
jgi:rubrerythrin